VVESIKQKLGVNIQLVIEFVVII